MPQPATLYAERFTTKSLKIYLLIDLITALKLNYKTQLLLEKNEIPQLLKICQFNITGIPPTPTASYFEHR